MATLSIDTATEHGIVVVARDDGSSASARWQSKGRHGENLFGHIEAAMAEAGVARSDLKLIGAGVGPGRFTSLRVGLATAKGLALGLDLPIVGASSLRVLARSIDCDEGIVRVPVMNAYRGDVFAAAYLLGEDGIDVVCEPFFGPPTEALALIRGAIEGRQVAVRGEAVAPHAELIEATFGSSLVRAALSPDPATPEALLGEVDHVMRTEGQSDLATLEPSYLRPSDAKLPDRPLRTEHSS